nr:hypothetical protein TorRG33x02_127810 [Ipomoea trifida]GMD65396.1 hypothetical protein TorRG33x02_127810 [Ipomoea batatas]
MAPRTLAIMNPPIAVIRIAANLLRFPTTMYADETNASVVQTEANHINLLITSTTLLSDFISLLTTVICTTTTAKDVKSATALEMKKILKAAVPATTALPSSSSPPGTVKIAEKATVANSTATTVTELVALLIPSLWSFLSSLAIPFMFCSFPLIAPIRPKLSFISAISSERGSPSAMSSAVLLSLVILRVSCGSFSSNALTTSICPWRAAKCNAFFPLDLVISNKQESVLSNSLTTATCPLVAADIIGVAFDWPIVLLSPGS